MADHEACGHCGGACTSRAECVELQVDYFTGYLQEEETPQNGVELDDHE